MEQALSRPAEPVVVEKLEVRTYRVPTDGPDGMEADGTLEWGSTTCVVVLAWAGGRSGIGYTYGEEAVGSLIGSKLAPLVVGSDAMTPASVWTVMFQQLRNAGRPGVGAMAVSALDVALWDLRARLLDQPLFKTLPTFRDRVPVYGSGGFCNYPLGRLADQLSGWVEQGIPRVKLKTSRDPHEDPKRLAAVRDAIGDGPEVLTDANGALTRKEALYWAKRFKEEFGAVWFEEPVSSDDVTGLRIVRDGGPPGLDVAAGEYGFVLADFARWLDGGAVDCLQADVTRCGGITGLLQVAGLSAAHQVDLSAHCAPALSAHAFCAVPRLRHLEYFHDHVRIESMFFDGTLDPVGGSLVPDACVPGSGLELKEADAAPYETGRSTHTAA